MLKQIAALLRRKPEPVVAAIDAVEPVKKPVAKKPAAKKLAAKKPAAKKATPAKKPAAKKPTPAKKK